MSKMYETAKEEIYRSFAQLEDDRRMLKEQIKALEVHKKGLIDEVRVEEEVTAQKLVAIKAALKREAATIPDEIAPLRQQLDMLRSTLESEKQIREAKHSAHAEKMAKLAEETHALTAVLHKRREELHEVQRIVDTLKEKVARL